MPYARSDIHLPTFTQFTVSGMADMLCIFPSAVLELCIVVKLGVFLIHLPDKDE